MPLIGTELASKQLFKNVIGMVLMEDKNEKELRTCRKNLERTD